MTEYRRALPEEEADILDFINMVFSQTWIPHNFATLIPKVYGHPGFHRLHYVAVRDGRIKGTVAVRPLALHPSEDTVLRVGYVGSVSVHGYSRGEGHMKALMKLAADDCRDNGFDLLCLSGQRQRYRYYGFDRGCSEASFTILPPNVRHGISKADPRVFSLRPVEKSDRDTILKIYDLIHSRPFFCEHDRDPELFFDVLCNFNCRPLSVYDEKGLFAGFLNGRDKEIDDFAFYKPEDILPALAALMKIRKYDTVLVHLFDTQTTRLLESVAESSSIVDSKLIRMLNVQRCLDTALKLKHRTRSLPDGHIVFNIGGEERICMHVDKQNAGVFPTDEAPDISLEAVDAGRFFFSASSAIIAKPSVPDGWLPLPLHISLADSF